MEEKKPFFGSLRDKIILQMVLVSALPILLIGGLVYYSMSEAEDSVGDSVDETRIALQEDTIASKMASSAWNLSIDIETWAAERINEVDNWTAAAVIVEAAREEHDDAGAAQNYLIEATGTDPFFADAYIVTSSGLKIAQADLWGMNPRVNEQAVEAIQKDERKLYVSDAYLDTKSGIYSYYVDVACPIDDRTSKVGLGTLISSIVIHPSYFATEYGSKVPDSRLVIWSRGKLVIADTGNLDRYMEDEPVWSDIENTVVSSITGGVDAIYPREHDHCYVIKEDLVAGFARSTNDYITIQFEDFEGLGWTVMIEQSAESALAPLDSLQELQNDLEENTYGTLMTIVTLMAVVVLAVLAVAYWMSRSITNPIVNLHRGVEEVVRGNWDISVGSDGGDEIGQLSRSFDEMTTTVKKSQDELQAYSENLQQMVEERTEELQQEVVQRRQAQEQLKDQTAMMINSEKARSMGVLVAGVAHELNNPMTGIINYAQYCIKKTDESSPVHPVLKDIEKEARRCANIIWNMITFARMDAEGEEDFREENINDLLDRVISLSNHRITMESIVFNRNFADDVPNISLKETAVEQMLLNVLGNAMDAVKECDDKEILVETRVEGGYIEVDVVDKGKGIAPDALKKVFDPFYTTKTVGTGTGLGLSVCQSICKQHGGDIVCESELGKGAKFTVRFPVESDNDIKEE